MGFWSPTNPETVRFSYNVIIAGMLCGAAILGQLLHVWLPFLIAFLLCAALVWQLYIMPLLIKPEDLNIEDKNKIAFHTLLTGNLSRIEAFQQSQGPIMQSQTKRIDDQEKAIQRLTTMLETLITQKKGQ